MAKHVEILLARGVSVRTSHVSNANVVHEHDITTRSNDISSNSPRPSRRLNGNGAVRGGANVRGRPDGLPPFLKLIKDGRNPDGLAREPCTACPFPLKGVHASFDAPEGLDPRGGRRSTRFPKFVRSAVAPSPTAGAEREGDLRLHVAEGVASLCLVLGFVSQGATHTPLSGPMWWQTLSRAPVMAAGAPPGPRREDPVMELAGGSLGFIGGPR
jgi:hypothetical protein